MKEPQNINGGAVPQIHSTERRYRKEVRIKESGSQNKFINIVRLFTSKYAT
jgi:hypothetical protein